MAKGLFGGLTDYSHQSFNDILTDIAYEKRNVSAFIEEIDQNLSIVKESGYWDERVPSDFQYIISYSLKHFHTAQEEFESILEEIQIEVKDNHCKRLERIATVGQEINVEIGQIWHKEYPGKEYGNENFRKVERIYGDTRDMAVNLSGIANVAARLKDFVGKTSYKMNNIPSVNLQSAQFGDNTVIVVGENNIVSPSQIKKNDTEALEKLLLGHQVAQSDINELKEILKNEVPDRENNRLGQKTNGWIAKMVNKCLDGTWSIGIGAAGKLLADAIKHYNGLFPGQ